MIMKKNYYSRIASMLALLLVFIMAQGQAPAPLARYTFDETSGTAVADATGNGHDAVASCDTCWKEGTIGGALAFYGTELVTLPASGLGLSSGSGSVAFWMKISGELDQINTIFWGGDNTTGGGFGPENEMHVHLEKPEPDIWTGGEIGIWILADPNVHIYSDPDKGTSAGVPPVNPILMTDGVWHHVACTWGGGSVVLYIDGVMIMSNDAYNPTYFNLTNIVLGQMINAGRTYHGLLDDFRIWNIVLSDIDVQDLATKNPASVDQPTVGETGLSVFPSPASGQANIRFNMEAGRNVSLSVYSITGAEMGTVYEGISTAGENVICIDAGNYAPGLYVVKLKAGNELSYTRVVLQ
jgi:hypothetical protein